MSKIIVNGNEKEIDTKELIGLVDRYLSHESDDLKAQFFNEVWCRMSDMRLDAPDLNGKTPEEYFFTGCLAYAEVNGFNMFEEAADSDIMDYCGVNELEVDIEEIKIRITEIASVLENNLYEDEQEERELVWEKEYLEKLLEERENTDKAVREDEEMEKD